MCLYFLCGSDGFLHAPWQSTAVIVTILAIAGIFKLVLLCQNYEICEILTVKMHWNCKVHLGNIYKVHANLINWNFAPSLFSWINHWNSMAECDIRIPKNFLEDY